MNHRPSSQREDRNYIEIHDAKREERIRLLIEKHAAEVIRIRSPQSRNGASCVQRIRCDGATRYGWRCIKRAIGKRDDGMNFCWQHKEWKFYDGGT